MIICSCKGVTKADIVKAVKKGALTVADIQVLTKAATGCGRCKNVVASLLAKELEIKQGKDTQQRISFD